MDNIDMKQFAGIALDSRKVEDGFLFAALPGMRVDGRDYIAAALQSGASGILTLSGTKKPEIANDVMWIEVENPRREAALCAARFYNAQPDYIAAVTGTNGKTSVTHFTQQIWDALEKNSASLGTLGLRSNVNVSDIADKIASLTTPDPVQLHEALADVSRKGVTHLALEASSHGLDQYRLDGVKIKAAAFTNLSRDHLDYHETLQAYLMAKMRLFSELLTDNGTAILNADIDEYPTIREICEKAGHKILSYGKNGADLTLLNLSTLPHGMALTLEVFDQIYDVTLPLAGSFQAHNVLAALGLVLAENSDDAVIRDKSVKALESLKGAPGRLELVRGHPRGAAVYIDYAHTPDALETVLKAMRPHVHGRLLCVFGCGGDRDPGKRAPMGRAVHDYADIGILTDDNPRDENPAAIRGEAKKGTPDAIEIEGRAEAIQYAIGMLEDGDVLVIAGKGHEQGQTIGDQTLPFCDKTQALKSIKELKK